MPRIEADQIIDLDPWTAFAVSQTTGDSRLRWDPFIKRQRHLDGATIAGVGVRTETTSKHGLTMVSEYTSFHPPERVGMKMVEGPWFFATMGGGWSFAPIDDESCEATWRYTFSIKPKISSPFKTFPNLHPSGPMASKVLLFQNQRGRKKTPNSVQEQEACHHEEESCHHGQSCYPTSCST